jgi:hypothetical protein
MQGKPKKFASILVCQGCEATNTTSVMTRGSGSH